MISKPVPASSFYHTCRYICQKPGAVILATEGVREHDYKLMAEDFLRQQQSRPGKKMACFHSILSFYPGEKPSDKTMQEIAEKYLDRLGIVNTQYAITKHTDRAHLHLHVVANIVNNDGKSIPDSWIGLRGKKIAQQLTKEYNLVPAIRKNLELTNLKSLNNSEKIRYQIYKTISENLPGSRNLEDLRLKLLPKGIEMVYKYKGKTDEIQGISFKRGNQCFKGSSIDRQFSFFGLQKTFQKQLQQSLHQAAKNRKKLPGTPANRSGLFQEKTATKELGLNLEKNLTKGIDILLRTEMMPDQIPNELLQKKKRQKRKGRSI